MCYRTPETVERCQMTTLINAMYLISLLLQLAKQFDNHRSSTAPDALNILHPWTQASYWINSYAWFIVFGYDYRSWNVFFSHGPATAPPPTSHLCTFFCASRSSPHILTLVTCCVGGMRGWSCVGFLQTMHGFSSWSSKVCGLRMAGLSLAASA